MIDKLPAFKAFAGEANRVTVARIGTKTFTIEDLGARITAGAGCTAISASKARCIGPGNRSDSLAPVNLGGNVLGLHHRYAPPDARPGSTIT